MTNESLSTGNEWTSVKMSTSFRTNSTASANHSDGVKQEGSDRMHRETPFVYSDQK